MKLTTGKVAFPIEFDNGDKDVIYFNPNDREFIRRVMDFENSIDKRIKNINIDKYKANLDDGVKLDINMDDISSIANMTPEQMDSLRKKIGAVIDADAEYQKAIKEELNEIFQSDVSSVIFKYCEPLDNVVVTDENGNETSEVFIMLFVNAFSEEVKKHQAKVTPAMQKHMEKYSK